MAADLTQSFMGKHFEKIVVAAAAVVFVAAMAMFVFGRHNQSDARTSVATKLKDIENQGKVTDLDKVTALKPEERISLGIGRPSPSVDDFKTRMTALGPAWQAVPKMEVMILPTEPKGPEGPPPPVVPVVQKTDRPDVAVDRGVTTETIPMPLAKLEYKTVAYNDAAWVTVSSQVNLTAQLDAYRKAHVTPQQIYITRVDIQRRELKPDGTWTDWKAVAPYVPASILVGKRMPKMPASSQDKKTVGEWASFVYKEQASVRRMPLPLLVALDGEGKVLAPIPGVEQPSLKAPEPTPTATSATATTASGTVAAPVAPPVASGGSAIPDLIRLMGEPAKGPIPTAAATPSGTGAHALGQDVSATVWANDLTVEPGKTYEYEMRVSIMNPVFLNPAVKNEKDRWALEFTGPWSEPSADAVVPPLVEFFFIGGGVGRPNLLLHRWIHGQWVIHPSAQCTIGAPVVYTKRAAKILIPGSPKESVIKDIELNPNVFLVDAIRNVPFLPVGQTTRRMAGMLIYTDAIGRLLQRTDIEDIDKGKLLAKRADVLPVMPSAMPIGLTPVQPPPVVTPVKPPLKPRPTPTR
jgi:hypothetical protein